MVCGFSGSASSQVLSSRYDAEIQHAVRKWWPDFPDWKLYKAQLYQESLLDPVAVSRSGARGIAQFMPATWEEVTRQLGVAGTSPHDTKFAIEAGAFYMMKMRWAWRENRTSWERHDLAMASYNAGLGNIQKARKLCQGGRLWEDVKPCLYQVTKARSAETLNYVERIHRWRKAMQ